MPTSTFCGTRSQSVTFLVAARLPAFSSDARCLLTDTVGFITDLPHDLVAAFRATLEEIASADVLLHVRSVLHFC